MGGVNVRCAPDPNRSAAKKQVVGRCQGKSHIQLHLIASCLQARLIAEHLCHRRQAVGQALPGCRDWLRLKIIFQAWPDLLKFRRQCQGILRGGYVNLRDAAPFDVPVRIKMHATRNGLQVLAPKPVQLIGPVDRPP